MSDTPPTSTVLRYMQHAVFAEANQTVSARDAMLYALGLGFGADPCDPSQLRYVFERDLQVFPTMAITLCYPRAIESTAVGAQLDMRHVLHVFQGFELFAPIPLDRPLVGQQRVTGVFDKGEKRGVFWTYENDVRIRETGERVCRLMGASMSRVGGGVGGPKGESPAIRAFPARAPDAVRDIATLPQQALIYRLSGDYNTLHADPQIARQAGFAQPILHGRCTFGIAGRAIVEALGDTGGALTAMQARFSASVFPGETLRVEIWREPDDVLFRCSIPAREVVVLDHGVARLTPALSRTPA